MVASIKSWKVCTSERSALRKLQNRGLRIVFWLNNLSNVKDIHINAHLQALDLRQEVSLLKVMHSMADNGPNCDERDICTRSRTGPILNRVLPKSQRFRMSPSYNSPSEWNKLKVELRSNKDKNRFKYVLKTYHGKLFKDDNFLI